MKVTCKLMGRTGNQLFQIATTIAYSLKYGIDYCIPKNLEKPQYENKVFYSPYLNYCDEEVVTATIYKEPFFHYQEIPPPHSNHTLLCGYFQSEAYFKEYREEILRIFNIHYESKEGYVSCHVRRGDYLSLEEFHPTVTLDYIYKSIYHFTKLGYNKFLFFSDDISWCRQNIRPDMGLYFKFSEGKTDVEDLALASSCEHNIGSNSAYSFFIHWLNKNPNKIGVFPKKTAWFGAKLNHNVDSLYMKEWCLI